jgi:hypothetical protein
MAYDTVRVLRYKGYMDWARWQIDRFKEAAGEPRRWQVHNHELMDRWVERAEIQKEARDRTAKGQQPIPISRHKDPQVVLTREFFNYYRSQQEESMVADFYQFCTGNAMSRSKKRPTLYNDKEEPYASPDTWFDLQRKGLESLINFVGWIVGVPDA